MKTNLLERLAQTTIDLIAKLLQARGINHDLRFKHCDLLCLTVIDVDNLSLGIADSDMELHFEIYNLDNGEWEHFKLDDLELALQTLTKQRPHKGRGDTPH